MEENKDRVPITSWVRNWIELETTKDDKPKTWNHRAWLDERRGLTMTGAEAWQYTLFQVDRNAPSWWMDDQWTEQWADFWERISGGTKRWKVL